MSDLTKDELLDWMELWFGDSHKLKSCMADAKCPQAYTQIKQIVEQHFEKPKVSRDELEKWAIKMKDKKWHSGDRVHQLESIFIAFGIGVEDEES